MVVREGWEEREAWGGCCVILPILRQGTMEFGPSKSRHSMERLGAMTEVKIGWKFQEVPDKLDPGKLE